MNEWIEVQLKDMMPIVKSTLKYHKKERRLAQIRFDHWANHDPESPKCAAWAEQLNRENIVVWALTEMKRELK